MKSLKLYFILYDQRSGSTLLSSLLGKWMKTNVAPETNLPIDIVLKYSNQRRLSSTDCISIQKMIRHDRKIGDWGITNELISSV